MKRLFFLLLACTVTVALSAAEKFPKKVLKAQGAVASLLTYEGGVVKGNGTAVLVGGNGNAVVAYPLMCGADSAVLIDTKGKQRTVTGIVGLNDVYDCVKIRVGADKKLVHMPLSRTGAASGDELYMLAYGKKNSGEITRVKVKSVDSLYSHAYYTLDVNMQERFSSLPLVNAEGELVAIVQPVAAGDSCCYALGATVADELVTTPVAYGRGRYQGMGIRTLLPEDKESALSCMYIQTIMGDSASYRNAVNDFVRYFPESHEGYMCDAEHLALYCGDIDAAEAAWKKALAVTNDQSAVYFGKAKVLNVLLGGKDSTVTFDNFLEQLDKAIAIDNRPMYVVYKADALFAAGRYPEAYECYMSLSATEFRGAEIFAKASQCKSALNEFDKAVELMDSAVNLHGKDGLVASAPYVLTRALLKYSAGKYREAVFDYNRYEEILGVVPNADFYLLRSQAEVKAKMYQQALNDLEKAISIVPSNAAPYIEKGMLCYRLGLLEDGVEALDKANELLPDSPNVHYLLGLIYIRMDNKKVACGYLQRAVELGHPDAAAVLAEQHEK